MAIHSSAMDANFDVDNDYRSISFSAYCGRQCLLIDPFPRLLPEQQSVVALYRKLLPPTDDIVDSFPHELMVAMVIDRLCATPIGDSDGLLIHCVPNLLMASMAIDILCTKSVDAGNGYRYIHTIISCGTMPIDKI